MDTKKEIIDAVIIAKANSKTGRSNNPVVELEDGAKLKDLCIDSLDVMEIIMECERIFGVTIPDDKLMNIYAKEDIYNVFEA